MRIIRPFARSGNLTPGARNPEQDGPASTKDPALRWAGRRPKGRPLRLKAGGLFVLAAGLWVLARGLAYRDPYEIILAGAALLVWCLLFAVGFCGAKRLDLVQPAWAPPVPLTAGRGGGVHLVTGPEAGSPWFFRLHFLVKGEFLPAADRRFLISAEAVGGGEAGLSLAFPMSGVFHGAGFLCLRDVFGFFSFVCAQPLHRSFPIQPEAFHKKPLVRIDPFSGAEDKQSRSQNDEERYYMREYAPGDRFRDINWKTSERLATLITRISPHTQEKTRLVHVGFRNYGPAAGATLLSLWLLDRTKARLAMFLRTLKEEHPEFIFHISTATDERTIQSGEEVAAFLDELAAMEYRPAAGSGALQQGGELYLFSTAFDTGLPGLLAARAEAPSYVFLTMPARRARLRGGADPAAVFHAGSVFAEGFFPVSGFLPRRGIPQLESAPVPRKGSLEITYAEVRL
ncbi:MAG: DUF58 domain-containing protein [Spirochaetales bacterium]|jgi:hypothetical protein|nr:DUF58 domain-containing protein [Spirochaetales bacterium]